MSSHILSLLLTLWCAVTWAAPAPDSATVSALPAPPSRIELSYDVLKGGMRIARIDETFTHQQGHYQLDSVSQATGLLAFFKPETIRIHSEGVVTAQGLRPLTFTSTRKLDTERNSRAEFDWPHHQITLIDRLGKRSQNLPEGTQDRLSAMYQFMFLPLSTMQHLDFNMTNGTKFDLYNYTLTLNQQVTIPLGSYKAHYLASPKQSDASRTEVWIAPSLNNLPCKVVITDGDGTALTQVLIRSVITP